jgi:hypothetical protein
MQHDIKMCLRVEGPKIPNFGNKLKCSTTSRSRRLTQVESKEFRKLLNVLESTDKSTNK